MTALARLKGLVPARLRPYLPFLLRPAFSIAAFVGVMVAAKWQWSAENASLALGTFATSFNNWHPSAKWIAFASALGIDLDDSPPGPDSEQNP